MILVLTFGGVMAVTLGAYWLLVLMPEQRERSSLKRRLKTDERARTEVRVMKQEEMLSGIGLLHVTLARFDLLSVPLKRLLDQADLKVTVGTFVLMSTTCFFGTMLIVNLYVGAWWLGLLLGAIAMMIPYGVVGQIRTRRIHKFEEQFPEAIELVARTLRAGHALSTGLKMVSEELPAPAGPEFKLLYERQNFGADMPDALRAFAVRIPSLDARFFVTAVLTQREAGGNLSEVLDRLAGVMRERFRVKREVRVRSAHGRMTAYVLTGMPPVIGLVMFSSNPDQLRLMTTDPLGIRMIGAAIILQVVGTLIVRKLVEIDY